MIIIVITIIIIVIINDIIIIIIVVIIVIIIIINILGAELIWAGSELKLELASEFNWTGAEWAGSELSTRSCGIGAEILAEWMWDQTT